MPNLFIICVSVNPQSPLNLLSASSLLSSLSGTSHSSLCSYGFNCVCLFTSPQTSKQNMFERATSEIKRQKQNKCLELWSHGYKQILCGSPFINFLSHEKTFETSNTSSQTYIFQLPTQYNQKKNLLNFLKITKKTNNFSIFFFKDKHV